jgi:hypothetical protein
VADKDTSVIEKAKAKILTEEEIADTSRYQFAEEELYLPELGGSIVIRPMTVEQRQKLPSMRDEDGNFKPTLKTMAASFAALVVNPKLTPEKAEKFIGKLPTTAYDAVQMKLAELIGSTEEARATRKEFRPAED